MSLPTMATATAMATATETTPESAFKLAVRLVHETQMHRVPFCLDECDFKNGGSRRSQDTFNITEIDFSEECVCHPGCLNNVLVALCERNWLSVTKISFRNSPHAKELLRAMQANPHNFPSLCELDVCKTDVVSQDLDNVAEYLCTNPFFVRDIEKTSGVTGRECVFVRIHNSLGTTWAKTHWDGGIDCWPESDNEFGPSRTFKTDAMVVYRNKLSSVAGPMPLRMCGGYKSILS
jgi:hypothetical protein